MHNASCIMRLASWTMHHRHQRHHRHRQRRACWARMRTLLGGTRRSRNSSASPRGSFSSSTAAGASRTPSAPRARAAKARVAASRQSRKARVRDPRGVVPDDGGTQRHSAMYPNVSNNLVSGALRGDQPYTQKSRAWRPRQRTRASLPHTARSCWAALCRLTSSATQKTEEATIKERFGQ
jgi:hypothetical protein